MVEVSEVILVDRDLSLEKAADLTLRIQRLNPDDTCQKWTRDSLVAVVSGKRHIGDRQLLLFGNGQRGYDMSRPFPDNAVIFRRSDWKYPAETE